MGLVQNAKKKAKRILLRKAIHTCKIRHINFLSPAPSDFRAFKNVCTAKPLNQEWLRAKCPDFVAKDQWPPNSPDLNPLDYHVWGAMLEAYHKLQAKPKTIAELKEALQLIWDNLPQGPIDTAVKDFSKRLKACVEAGGGHFEYSK